MPRHQLEAPAVRQGASTALAEEDIVNGLQDGEEAIMEDQQDLEGEGYASSTPTSSLTWIAWFCSLPGHEYFCEVSDDFIEDDFNLTGLASMVPFWKEAMEMVLDVEPEDALKIPDVTIVESSAELLYGLVHQRYILTRPGLQSMVEKYEAGHFGTCPRVYCQSTHVAPCGRTDLPGIDTVKLYCPNCNDIYTPPSSRFQGVDGAFFGTTFPHLLFQTFRELAPAPFCPPPVAMSPGRSPGYPQQQFVNPNPNGGQKPPNGRIYIAKIYGFRVSERARSGPRMAWLRMRPQTLEELDHVDHKGRWITDGQEYDSEDENGGEGKFENFDDSRAADDEDEEEEEEEEEEEDQALPPAPAPPRHGGRQRVALSTPVDDDHPSLSRIWPRSFPGLTTDDHDSDEDDASTSMAKPLPPIVRVWRARYASGNTKSRRSSLPLAGVASAGTDTDAGFTSSTSCSSALDTPREDFPVLLPRRTTSPFRKHPFSYSSHSKHQTTLLLSQEIHILDSERIEIAVNSME